MPEVIAEQSYDIVAGLIFLAGESAADGWLQADEAEELGSNLGDGNFTRAAAVPQDPGACERGGEEVEAMLAVAPFDVLGLHRLERLSVGQCQDGHDAVGLGELKRTENYGVCDAEYGGGGSDAQGESQDGGSR